MEIKYVEPLYQQAYMVLRELITKGKYKAGEHINTSRLAKEFNISRTPLREAIRQLISEGILVQEGLNIKVVALSEDNFKSLCQCRLILEKEVIKSAIKNIEPHTEQEIASLLEETERLLVENNSIDIMEKNTLFHEKIISLCDNPYLVQLLNGIRSLLFVYRVNINSDYTNLDEIYKEHKMIFLNVKKRDLQSALISIENHLVNDERRGLKSITLQRGEI